MSRVAGFYSELIKNITGKELDDFLDEGYDRFRDDEMFRQESD